MKLFIFHSMLGLSLIASFANADIITIVADVDSVDSGLVFDSSFSLPPVASIDAITICAAHTWGGDLEIVLTSPETTAYVPMFDSVDLGGSGDFDMGMVAGDFSLSNVAAYTFVESGAGGLASVGGFLPGGTYDAESWNSGPHSAGIWNINIFDDAAGDPTSISSIKIEYTLAVPEPGVAFSILVAMPFLPGRRGVR